MRLIFIITALLISWICGKAQNQIKGQLTDPTATTPVQYATVALYSLPDSTVATGVITKSDGLFAFNNLDKGSYFYEVKYLGYKDVKSRPIALDGSNGTLDAGKIVLEEESKSLGEVNVIGEKLKGTEAVDRTIYNIPDAAAKAASNGTDILKRIPAVQVDLSNNISLQGNSNILILIDGKERDKEFIAQLDPKSIEKVEVITNPSSKYDAGIRGVINVILKKELRAGVNGSFDVEVPTSRGHYLSSPYASLDYGTGKFRFFTSFNGHYEGFDNLKKGYRRNGNLEYTADGEGLFSYSTSTIHYGIDFFINDKNTLNLYGNYNPQQFNMDYMLDKYLKQNGKVTDYFTTDMKSHDAMRGSFYSLYYKKAFTKAGHELSLDMNFYDFHSTRNNSYLDQNYLDDLTTPDGDAVLRTETLKPTRKSFNLKLDYVLPVSDKLNFETGYKFYRQHIDDSYFYSGSPATYFDYKENRQSVYAKIGAKLNKFRVQAGARAEYSDIYISDDKTTDYFFLLPNMSVQYDLGQQQTVKAVYTRTIQRPSSGDLNPSVTQFDEMNISRGNPNLDPSYTDRFLLSYSKNFKSSFVSPEIYWDHISDNFQQVIRVNDQNISESYVDNFGTADEFGMGVSASLQVTKWLSLNPYLKGFFSRTNAFQSPEFSVAEQSDWGWMGSMFAQAKLPKGFSLWSYAVYNSPVKRLQTTNYRDALYLIGLEKSIMKEKGKIGITWGEPFKEQFRFQRTVTENGDLYQDDDNYVKIRTLFILKFTYRFNSGKEVKKLDIQRNLERDGKNGLG